MTPEENALIDAIRELFDERFDGLKQAFSDHKDEMLRGQARHSKRLNGHDAQFVRRDAETNARFSQQDARTRQDRKMLWFLGILAAFTIFKDISPAALELLRGLLS